MADTVTAAFRFRSGVAGTGTWCFVAPPQAAEDSVTITGRKGIVRFSTFAFSPIELTTAGGTERFRIDPPEHIQGPLIETIVAELRGRGALSLDGSLGRENIPGHGPDHIRIKSLSLHPMELKNYDKEERFDPATVEALKGHYIEILRLLGEDPAREGC